MTDFKSLWLGQRGQNGTASSAEASNAFDLPASSANNCSPLKFKESTNSIFSSSVSGRNSKPPSHSDKIFLWEVLGLRNDSDTVDSSFNRLADFTHKSKE